MVTIDRHLDSVFSALADPTRRAILAHLTESSASVGELARPFRVSRPAISKHLRVLERAGLVRRARLGRISRCELDATAMRAAADWMERYRVFWTNRLLDLKHFVESDPGAAMTAPKKSIAPRRQRKRRPGRRA